ncbi:short-chain dehydrogenase [Subtercola boreus]|uniref:Short-chain dehydrogenase n=1 Tax=Subtercola boreus TaxID=120213 RepID=A0A3E0VE18_9MICO|nr:oxidoreductase [Subtercola boreus]RFA08166.1 short-chain dehydrogenase [Subtercola boreus]TQL54943.1 NADP-dependent 3-hydroxy acid dehydrogenase YdfG [Subtercola boreus]
MTPPWTAADIPDQSGKTFVITGANSGLGRAAAAAVAGAGGRVILACRNTAKGDAAAREMTGDVIVRRLDVADLASVREFAAETEQVDVLINNAGVMATPEGRTADGFETQFGTNFLGHFALTGLLLPKITGRVVSLSSLAHLMGRIDLADPNWLQRRYSRWPAYGQSKLADLMFAYELHRRLKASGSEVRSLAAHPGLARTELHTHTDSVQSALIAAFTGVGQSAAMGALPVLYAATAPDAASGAYFGPGGPGEVRGFPRPAFSTPAARNLQMAADLWAMAEELTGVSFLSPAPVGSAAVPVAGAPSSRSLAVGGAVGAGALLATAALVAARRRR